MYHRLPISPSHSINNFHGFAIGNRVICRVPIMQNAGRREWMIRVAGGNNNVLNLAVHTELNGI